MRLIQKVILIIFLYFIKLQMKQKELELENEIGSETELEYFFKGKKLRRVFELAFLLALGAMI